MGPAMELKGKVTFGAIWTMFGQSEINDAANITASATAWWRGQRHADDLGEPDLPFVVGDWEEGGARLTDDDVQHRSVRSFPRMRMLPMRIPRSVLIPTDGLPMNPLDGSTTT
jgi:hypothetical protein